VGKKIIIHLTTELDAVQRLLGGFKCTFHGRRDGSRRVRGYVSGTIGKQINTRNDDNHVGTTIGYVDERPRRRSNSSEPYSFSRGFRSVDDPPGTMVVQRFDEHGPN